MQVQTQRWADATSRAWTALGDQHEKHMRNETRRRVLYAMQAFTLQALDAKFAEVLRDNLQVQT